MEFEHQEHWALYERVRDCLEREFGDDVEAHGEQPAFFLQLDAASMVVSVQAAGPKAAVTIYGRPLNGREITPQLAVELLRVNFGHEIPFGAVGLNDEDDVSFSHVVMGEGLDLDAFSLLIRLLADKLEDLQALLDAHAD